MKTHILENQKTKVLLIGLTKFYEDETINALPNVKRNITLIKKAFLSNQVLNITEEDITVSFNETKTDIERKLIQASRDAKNHNYTLIVYYSGHGILSTQNYKLYLSASNTTHNYLESDGISVSAFRETIENSRAGRKIVILDACHSGAVHNTMNSLSSQIQSELNKFEGTYVISSASQDEPALYPSENPNLPTFFTGKFLEILNKGIKNNKPFISIRDIFEEIEISFREQGNIPLPQQSVFQNADKMIFAENNAFDEIYNEATFNSNNSENQIIIRFEKKNSLKYYLLSKIASVIF